MVPDRRVLIGRTFPPIKCVIDEETIQSYLQISGEDMPAYQNDEAALAMGYDRRIIPPSYGPFLALLIRSFDWEKDFLVDSEKGMPAIYGEEEIEYLRPVHLGENLIIKSSIVDITQKMGKKAFDVARVRFNTVDYTDADVFRGEMTFILYK